MAKFTEEARAKELQSRGDARLECAALDDILKMTIMLLQLYKINIEQGLQNNLGPNVIAN